MVLSFPDYSTVHFTVTPSDAVALKDDAANPDGAKYFAGALYVGTQGNVSVIDANGNTVTFVGAQGFLPILVKQVRSTGTTATDIIALFKK